MPDSEIKVDPAEFKKQGGGDFARVMDFARIMVSLPDDAKQRVFAGERIKLKVQNLPPNLATSLQNLYRGAWDEYQKSQVDTQNLLGTPIELKPVPESDLEKVTLTFYITQGERQVFRSVLGVLNGFSSDPAIGTPAEILGKLIPSWPKPPQSPQMPKYDFAKGTNSLDDARKSGLNLNEKIKVIKPDIKRDMVFSDCVAAN
jgi:hypothetical protein